MKRRKKRNPEFEPFASLISDDERCRIVRKAVHIIDDSEALTLFSDLDRATRKVSAAAAQLAGQAQGMKFDWLDGSLNADLRFQDAQASESSATASVRAMMPAVLSLAQSGVKARRGWRRGGRARHDVFSEESENHDNWDNMRAEILGSWTQARKPSARRLSMMIAARDPKHPPYETVRGYFKRKKNKVG